MGKRGKHKPLPGGSPEPARSGHPQDLPPLNGQDDQHILPPCGVPLTPEEMARAIKGAATRKVGRTDFQQTDSSPEE